MCAGKAMRLALLGDFERKMARCAAVIMIGSLAAGTVSALYDHHEVVMALTELGPPFSDECFDQSKSWLERFQVVENEASRFIGREPH